MANRIFDKSLEANFQQVMQKYASQSQVNIKCQFYDMFSDRIKVDVANNTDEYMEIIDLTSDTEEMISQNDKKKEEISGDSVLQGVQDTPNNKINNVNSKQFEDFCSYIADCLEESDVILNQDSILQMLKDENIPKLENICNFLSNKLSPQGIFNLCHTLCTVHYDNRNILIENICSSSLFSQFSESTWSSYYQITLKEITETFPEIVCNKFFKPLFLKNCTNLHDILSVHSYLKISEKKYLLSHLIANYNEVESWNLKILNALYIPTCDNKSKRKLISLMNKSEDNFKKDKIFGKLLISIIDSLSADLIDLKPSLEYIVDNHSSVFKGVANRSLKSFEDRVSSTQH